MSLDSMSDWYVSASGVNLATATKTAEEDQRHVIKSISVTSDSSGSILVIQDDGVTVDALDWGATSSTVVKEFPSNGFNRDLSVSITGTAVARVTIAGVSIPKPGG